MSNIIRARFIPEGKNQLETDAIYQYNYGNILDVSAIDGLPQSFEVHFCNKGDDEAPASVGLNGQVEIPDAFLQTGEYVYAYIYLHTGESDGETEYKIVVPVAKRQTVSHETPTPVQQGEIEQVMAALNAGVDRVEDIYEEIDTMSAVANTLPEGSPATADYDHGVLTLGIPKGDKGDEGYSPSASVSRDNDGVVITIIDKSGTTTQKVYDEVGYMNFRIDDNGHLIYEKTEDVDVDFAIIDGHLYMGGDFD